MKGKYISNEEYDILFDFNSLKLSLINEQVKGNANGYFHFTNSSSYNLFVSEIEINNGSLNNIPFDKFNIDISKRNNRWIIPNLLIDFDSSFINLDGWFTTQHLFSNESFISNTDSLNINLEAYNINLESIKDIIPFKGYKNGKLNSTISLYGDIINPVISAELSINNININEIETNNITGTLIQKNNNLYLKGFNIITENGEYIITGFIPFNYADLNDAYKLKNNHMIIQFSCIILTHIYNKSMKE